MARHVTAGVSMASGGRLQDRGEHLVGPFAVVTPLPALRVGPARFWPSAWARTESQFAVAGDLGLL